MKNFIDYYYNFNISSISFSNGRYVFYNGKDRYMLKQIENDEVLLQQIKLSYQLNGYKHFFLVIPNRDNNYITFIENKPYILLKLGKIVDDRISIFDIKTDMYVELDNGNSVLNRYPWIKLWEIKIDYFEDWFSMKHDSYKNLFPLFHYFIGIAENALFYLKQSDKEELADIIDNPVVSHNRLSIDYSLYDYYDPTNIIIDHASRDVSEYVKSAFVNKLWDLDVLRDYLKNHQFSKYGIRIMLSRIMFPSFFFDYIEEMIVNNCDFDFLYLETRAADYQRFLKEISLFFKEEYGISVISWIIKET